MAKGQTWDFMSFSTVILGQVLSIATSVSRTHMTFTLSGHLSQYRSAYTLGLNAVTLLYLVIWYLARTQFYILESYRKAYSIDCT